MNAATLRTLNTLAGLAVLLLATTQRATASVPSAANSSIPAHIVLVGHDGLAPDPHGRFTVVVRDLAGNPLDGIAVDLDFTGAPDLAISSVQSQPGMTFTSCAPPVVSATTNAAGVATFDIIGAVGTHHPNGLAPGGCTANITATPPSGAPVVLGECAVAAFDLNGIDGVNPDDVHLWLGDFGMAGSPCYSDFDNSNGVGASDLSRMIDVVLGKGSTESGSLCFGGSEPPQLVQSLSLTLDAETVQCSEPPSGQFGTNTCGANRFTEYTCSVTLPGSTAFTEITGIEATIAVLGAPGITMPGFFQFSPGSCHPNALSGIRASADVTESCLATSGAIDIFGGSSSAFAWGLWPEPGSGALDRGRIVAMNVVMPHYIGPGIPGSGGPCTYGGYGSLAGGVPTKVLGFRIANNGLPCATSSCASPVALVLQELKITSRTSGDNGPGMDPLPCPTANTPFAPDAALLSQQAWVIHPAPGSQNVVYVNGVPPGLVLDAPPPPAVGKAWLAVPAPNPASSSTLIHFQIPNAGPVNVAIFDVAGRKVRTLIEGVLTAETRSVIWDGRGDSGELVRSGAYFCRLVTPGARLSRTIFWQR